MRGAFEFFGTHVPLLVQDRALNARFKAGDRDALATVFSFYAPRVVEMLGRGFSFDAGGERVRFSGYTRRFELEDVLQDVFRRAFAERARLAYDGLRPYGAYLATIARNLVIDSYTARKRELACFVIDDSTDTTSDDWASSDDPFAEHTPAPTGRPERDLMSAELRGLVQTFKGSLGEREQAIFVLRFDEALSHNAIAERTGFSVSQVKTTESKLRAALLRHLKGHGYLEHVRQGGHAVFSGEH